MVRLNLFKKPKEETPIIAATVGEVSKEIPIPPEPPKILDTRKNPEPTVQIQYVEKEINLSLLNDKLNYLTMRLEEFLASVYEDDDKKSPPV